MLGHPPPAFQQPPPLHQQSQQAQPPTADPNALHHSPPQPLPGTLTLRLRDDSQIQPVTRPLPRGRKRKSPATAPTETAQPPPAPLANPPTMQHPGIMQPHPLPPLMHPHIPGYPMPYPPPPGDYTPGGMPPPHPGPPPPGHPGGPPLPQSPDQQGRSASNAGRTLSQSKRAEQNRKAQRAFRERRDQHVKTLESRSQLLDAALASADEANRRWEECRTIVDQLRIENATLRAALQATQAQLIAVNPNASVPLSEPGTAGAVHAANGVPSIQGQLAEQSQHTSGGNEDREAEQAPGTAEKQEKK